MTTIVAGVKSARGYFRTTVSTPRVYGCWFVLLAGFRSASNYPMRACHYFWVAERNDGSFCARKKLSFSAGRRTKKRLYVDRYHASMSCWDSYAA
jgi:hypothetical protein